MGTLRSSHPSLYKHLSPLWGIGSPHFPELSSRIKPQLSATFIACLPWPAPLSHFPRVFPGITYQINYLHMNLCLLSVSGGTHTEQCHQIRTNGGLCYGLIYVPCSAPRICSSPDPQYLRMWPYLEIGMLQMQLVYMRSSEQDILYYRYPYKRKKRHRGRDTPGEDPCDDRGKDWSVASSSQGTQRRDIYHQTLVRGKRGFHLEPQRECDPEIKHLDFWPLDPRSIRK